MNGTGSILHPAEGLLDHHRGHAGLAGAGHAHHHAVRHQVVRGQLELRDRTRAIERASAAESAGAVAKA